jgi:hypothetical protein
MERATVRGRGDGLVSGDLASVSLDEYLVPFRDAAGPPRGRPTPTVRRTWRTTSGKWRAYHLLRDALPAPVLDFAVERCYYPAKTLTGRNPGNGRVLPDFLVIGAAKSGTTSLFDWMCQHPAIMRPTTDGRPRKELGYFDFQFHLRTDWYRAHFPLERDRRQFVQRHGHPFLTGEATASYLSDHWVPKRVAGLLPDVKLIVTLRNPVDRAYSAFQMSRREGLEEHESFESAIAFEHERLAPLQEQIRRDPRYIPAMPPPLGYWSYLQRSRYDEHIARWLEFFGRDQLLFLKFEDLAAAPQQTLDGVYEFLGLAPHGHGEFPKLNAGSYDDMSPHTRDHLAEYFRPHNERLRTLTGVDFGWDR